MVNNALMKHLLATLLLVSNQIQSPQIIWQNPISGSWVVNRYLAPQSEYSAGHRGIDLAGELDEPVYAPEAGEISFIGKVGYRNVLSLETRLGKITFEPVCSELPVGYPVIQGEAIGRLCQPDAEYLWHCQLSCLHLGLITETGYLSAERFIFGMSPSRLLP